MKSLSQLSEELNQIKEEYNYQYCIHLVEAISKIMNAAKEDGQTKWKLTHLTIQHYSDFEEPDMGLGLYSEMIFRNSDKKNKIIIEFKSHDNDSLTIPDELMLNFKLKKRIAQFHENFFTRQSYDIIESIANKLMKIHLKRSKQESPSTEYSLERPIKESHQYLLGEAYYARYEKEHLESFMNQENNSNNGKKLKV